MTSKYYKWDSEADFEAWHLVVKNALGIPYANRNAATGEIDENATWTTSYTELRIDLDGVFFAEVEDFIANNYPSGLGSNFTPNLPAPNY